MKSSNALCLFVKAPLEGQVKTRLQPELSPEEAALLYKAMVEDLLNRLCKHHDFDVRIYGWPPDHLESLQYWLGNGFEYIPQRGENLGTKMLSAIENAFHNGYCKVLLVGSDVPSLHIETMEQALSSLESHDLVLGPSEDGGYYLIGMSEPHPEVFIGIPWSTDRVLDLTLEIINAHKLTVKLLERKTDIDTFRDVYALWKKLENYKQKGDLGSLQRTYEELQRVFTKSRIDVRNDESRKKS